MSGSMLPRLKGGEPILIVAWDFNDLHEKDLIIVWWQDKRYNVIHEILGSGVAANGEKYYITKGEGNMVRDNHVVTKENFVGKVILLPKPEKKDGK